MRFAIVGDNKHQKPTKNARGVCPVCGETLVAKCGNIRIHHWSHPSNSQCLYKENKGDWHIDWQNEFPDDWQEVVMCDPLTKEKNIADIKTPKGIILEFQHSHIKEEEKIARETFYKDMAWVVDGLNWLKIYSFFKIKYDQQCDDVPRKFTINQYDYETNFSIIWATSNVPVIYDFYDKQAAEQQRWREYLYFCFPYKDFVGFYVVPIKRQDFIKIVNDDRLQKMIKGIQNSIDKKSERIQNAIYTKKRKAEEKQQKKKEEEHKRRLITHQNAKPKAAKLKPFFEAVKLQKPFTHQFYQIMDAIITTKLVLTKGLPTKFQDSIYNPQYKRFNSNEWIECAANICLCVNDIDIKNCNIREFKCCPKDGKTLNDYYKNIAKDKVFFTGKIGKDDSKRTFSGNPLVVFVDKGSKTISVLCKNFLNNKELNSFSLVHVVFVDGIYYHYQYYSTKEIEIFLKMVCNNNKMTVSDIRIL